MEGFGGMLSWTRTFLGAYGKAGKLQDIAIQQNESTAIEIRFLLLSGCEVKYEFSTLNLLLVHVGY